VFVTQKDNSVKAQWRRLDREPFYKETGVTDDSPNKDKYSKPKTAQKPAPQKPVVAKPSDNGTQPPQPEPVAPTPPTTVPTPAPEPVQSASKMLRVGEPEKAPVSELDAHYETPKITAPVKIWDGKSWTERNPDESISFYSLWRLVTL
jgi:hypothetical protein